MVRSAVEGWLHSPNWKSEKFASVRWSLSDNKRPQAESTTHFRFSFRARGRNVKIISPTRIRSYPFFAPCLSYRALDSVERGSLSRYTDKLLGLSSLCSFSDEAHLSPFDSFRSSPRDFSAVNKIIEMKKFKTENKARIYLHFSLRFSTLAIWELILIFLPQSWRIAQINNSS